MPSTRGAARGLLSSACIPLTTAALPDGPSTAELGPRGSAARAGTSCAQLDGVSLSFWQVRTPHKAHSLWHLPWRGLFRRLLLPAPKKHHENNSHGTTGSPQ